MDDSRQNECRSVQRVGGNTLGALQISVEPAGLLMAAVVRDFSVKGIGLLVNSQVVPGTAIGINRQTTMSRFSKLRLSGQVRHATKLTEENWLLGCSFSRMLTVEDVEMLGA